MLKKIAILYQATPAPSADGVIKPMKIGGYSDSGADIGFSLAQNNFGLITPHSSPRESVDMDWVFPDSEEGINFALEKNAEILWLNTVLYKTHPIHKFANMGLEIIGQEVGLVDKFDNKWLMNNLLRQHNIPIPKAQLIEENNINLDQISYSFPMIIKPIRGRGSQGVVLVYDYFELENEASKMFRSKLFGNKIYVETFLAGMEITLTVMPPGSYHIDQNDIYKNNHWCLPPVHRFNHLNGIAPYSGNVAVINNSKVLSTEESSNDKIQKVMAQCEEAASLIKSKSPIRIDCRANEKGTFFLFDINLKPNLTGSSRDHRKDQDSLTAIAAQAIGWSYADLIKNIYNQKWKF